MAGDKIEVFSAGVASKKVRTEAIEALAEIGIDISRQRSKSVDEFAGQQFDYVITVCDNAKQQCPAFPGDTTRVHWSFTDPAAVQGDWETRLTAFRHIRAEIATRLDRFLQDLDTVD